MTISGRSRATALIILLSLLTAGCGPNGCNDPTLPAAKLPDVQVPCQSRNRTCRSNSDCCGTLTCNANRICSDGNGQGAGTPCSSSGQCGSTLTCENGVCMGGGGCVEAGSFCNSRTQCCGALDCSANMCSDGSCRSRGAACSSSGQCCGTLTCNGYCQ